MIFRLVALLVGPGGFRPPDDKSLAIIEQSYTFGTVEEALSHLSVWQGARKRSTTHGVNSLAPLKPHSVLLGAVLRYLGRRPSHSVMTYAHKRIPAWSRRKRLADSR